jgi:hypothetical protein
MASIRMKATWHSIRAAWQNLYLVSALTTVALAIASFFTGDMKWLGVSTFLVCIFSLPTAYGDLVQRARGRKLPEEK